MQRFFKRIDVVKRHRFAVAFAFLVSGTGFHFSGLAAQALSTPKSGPVIGGFGAVYAVPDVDCACMLRKRTS